MYERHLRRLRRRNTARREALRHAVHKYLGERVELNCDGSGAHVVLWPTKRVSEDGHRPSRITRRRRLRNIVIFPDGPPPPGLVLDYSRMNEKEIREGIRLLSEVFSYQFMLVMSGRRVYLLCIPTGRPVGPRLSLQSRAVPAFKNISRSPESLSFLRTPRHV
jgi:hypothetical protein